jgi:hypothetical protein
MSREKQRGLFSMGAAEKPLLNLDPIRKEMGGPSLLDRAPLPVTERPDLVGKGCPLPPGTPESYYELGECRVIITHDGGTYGWHMSISHESRYPRWDEIAEARYRLLPAVHTMAIVLPPLDHYINDHPNCFQVIQIAPPDPTRIDPSPGTEPPTEEPIR